MSAQPVLNRGKLIALEGLDGVGKTTQARLLARHLTSLNLAVVLTREPTNGPIGQKIRRIISHGREGISPTEELELFIADRREHVQQVIQPALDDGKIIITDRYYFSTMAYQGALGLDPWDIQQRHTEFAPSPDLVIILDLPLAEIIRRLQQRGRPLSHSFEQIDYLARVGEIFGQMEASSLVRIDGCGLELQVHSKILTLVDQFLHLPDQPAHKIDLGVN